MMTTGTWMPAHGTAPRVILEGSTPLPPTPRHARPIEARDPGTTGLRVRGDFLGF